MAFSAFGTPLAFSLALDLNPVSETCTIWPHLSFKRIHYTRPYTAPGFAKLWELSQGHVSTWDASQPMHVRHQLFRQGVNQKVAEIKQLFANREAHPLDVDPAGVTWLEKLLSRPWDLGMRAAQWDLVDFLATVSPEVKTNGKLLWMCARWIGEGPHLQVFRNMLQHGLEPDNLDVRLLQKWPAMMNPNMLGESIIDDPFFVEWQQRCLDIKSDFADCNALSEALLTANDAEFERVLASSQYKGCNIELSNNAFGQSATHLGVIFPKRLERLLEHGNDPNAVDAGGSTPLMYAAAYGFSRSVLLLLQHNADPGIVDSRNNRCYLDYAIKRNNWHVIEDVVRYLRENSQSMAAISMLDRCVAYYLVNGSALGDEESLPRLFALGADPDITYVDGSTLLHQARYAEEAEEILAAGFTNVHGLDGNGCTPLMSVLGFGNPGLLTILLDRGAGIHPQDRYGWTALHHACRYAAKTGIPYADQGWEKHALQVRIGMLANIIMLLSRGADSSMRDGCECACSLGGCSAMTTALHGLFSGISRWHSPRTLSTLPVELLAAYRYTRQGELAFLKDIRRFRAFEEAGLQHTCCRGRTEFHFAACSRATDSSSVRIEEEKFEATTMMCSPDEADCLEDPMFLDLARLYSLLEDRAQAAHTAATERQKRYAQSDFLTRYIVDHKRDEFRVEHHFSFVPNAVKFDGEVYWSLLDEYLRRAPSLKLVRPVQEFVDIQRRACLQIKLHIERMKLQGRMRDVIEAEIRS